MRFLALSTSFPRNAEDHAGRFVHDLHAGLVEEGHEVTTLCPAAEGAPERESTEAGQVFRIDYAAPRDLFYGDGLEANWKRSRRRLSQLTSFLRNARRRITDLSAEHDAVIGHWLWPGAATAVRGARREMPVIGIGHGGDLHLASRPLFGRWMARVLAGRLTGALVTTRAGAGIVGRRLRLDETRISVGPMGVDPAVFAPPTPGEVTQEGGLLGVGRLVPIKGFDLLVEAAAQLGQGLTLLGEGPERARLEALARRRRVRLSLPGRASRHEVAAALRSARCVVVPSRTLESGRAEGVPVVAVEALVSGTPILAAASGGLSDLLPPERLFPPGDAVALAERLRAELEGPRVAPATPEGLTRRDTAQRVLALLA